MMLHSSPLAAPFVTCSGVPPAAGTRINGPDPGAKTMTPFAVQAPPRPDGASQTTEVRPLATSVRFSRLSAKKPTWRLSGDQKGCVAPSL